MSVIELERLSERETIVAPVANRKTTRLRVAENRYRQSCKLVDARSGGVCEFCGSRRASEHHHRTPRGMGGSSRNPLIHRSSAIFHLCGGCHRETEAYRTLARDAGLLVRRDKDTTNAPISRRGDWVLLDDEGGFAPCPAPNRAA